MAKKIQSDYATERRYRGHTIRKGCSYWRALDWHYKTLTEARAAIDRHIADEEWEAEDQAFLKAVTEKARTGGGITIVKV